MISAPRRQRRAPGRESLDSPGALPGCSCSDGPHDSSKPGMACIAAILPRVLGRIGKINGKQHGKVPSGSEWKSGHSGLPSRCSKLE